MTLPESTEAGGPSGPVKPGQGQPLSAQLAGLRLDEVDGILHGLDLFRRVIGNFATEFFLEGHDEFDGIQAVSAQIVDEIGGLRDLGFVNAEMFDHNLLHAFGNVAHLSFLDVPVRAEPKIEPISIRPPEAYF
jgi:hypothetical protein